MNFGNPERPEIMGQFAGCIEGMAEACIALDCPVVSGNVSLYNETNGKAILPTPAIGAVGVLADYRRMATLAFKAAGEAIVLVGATNGHLGQSLWLREVAGLEAGPPPPVDLTAERTNGDLVRALIGDGAVTACHDLSDGGLLVAVAEMALAGGIGAAVEIPEGADPTAWLFGEDQGRYLVTAPNAADILARAAAAGAPAAVIGRTEAGATLTVPNGLSISLDTLRDTHEGWLPRYMAAP
jgi:phosphoribosylformylglycinamidine synthase